MREAGILMPISSLPSPWGIGTMGAQARAFIDFLQASGQSVWQVLPVGPTSYGDSPYQSYSSFAGNPYFIDFDDLTDAGLLDRSEYQDEFWGDDPARVDYGALHAARFRVLAVAVRRLVDTRPEQLAEFCRREASWLDDYALFMSLKEKFGGASWQAWPEEYRRRDVAAMDAARQELAASIEFWSGVQFLFFEQWEGLRAYAGEHDVLILGDLPIYAAEDSADVWANPQQFMLDCDLHPIDVAGCPPDGFSETGQLWGNPIFNWDRLREQGFAWWIKRIEFQFRLYDILRIDHFRGFDSYYAIPAGATDACRGEWREGPGLEFFQTLTQVLGPRRIIAEDLGFLTPSVRQLLADTGYPGMKVLEFAFDERDENGRDYQPHAYPANCVAYVGTHDNDTALGWLESADSKDVTYAREYLKLNQEEGFAWGMMRGIWASPANLAIVQMQDVLELGGEARMNEPSTLGGNWCWRALPGSFTREIAKRLRHEMELYDRVVVEEDAGDELDEAPGEVPGENPNQIARAHQAAPLQ